MKSRDEAREAKESMCRDYLGGIRALVIGDCRQELDDEGLHGLCSAVVEREAALGKLLLDSVQLSGLHVRVRVGVRVRVRVRVRVLIK